MEKLDFNENWSVLSQFTAEKQLKADKIFAMMIEFLSRGDGDSLVKRVGLAYQFDIVKKSGGPVVKSWVVDLRSLPPTCKEGTLPTADAWFTMTDSDFESVCMGKIGTKWGYLRGKIKIKGSLKKAIKFRPKLFPPPTPENMTKYTPAKL